MTIHDLPAPPEAPDPASCCGRGCSPCIFNYYDRAFAAWEDDIRRLGFTPETVLASTGRARMGRP
ncbi:MAG: oxidoreductase-like domain-containing protein [Alphaproteobacteria bacterium]